MPDPSRRASVANVMSLRRRGVTTYPEWTDRPETGGGKPRPYERGPCRNLANSSLRLRFVGAALPPGCRPALPTAMGLPLVVGSRPPGNKKTSDASLGLFASRLVLPGGLLGGAFGETRVHVRFEGN